MGFKNAEELRDFIKENSAFTQVYTDGWEGGIYPPYVIVGRGERQTVPADNRAYVKQDRFYIDLYKKKNDYVSDEALEQLLDDNDIYYSCETSWINDLRLEAVSYEI